MNCFKEKPFTHKSKGSKGQKANVFAEVFLMAWGKNVLMFNVSLHHYHHCNL